MKGKKSQLLVILSMIRQREKTTIPDLAEMAELSKRTIQRHCKVLNDYGFIVYIHGSPKGCYEAESGRVVYTP